MIACPDCRSNPHRIDDGCARCGDSGSVPVEIGPGPSPHRLDPHARERAEFEIRAVLIRARHLASVSTARELAAELSCEPRDPMASVEARGLGRADACRVLCAYVAAVSEHRRVGEYWQSLAGESYAHGPALEAHAKRIEAALPRHLRRAT